MDSRLYQFKKLTNFIVRYSTNGFLLVLVRQSNYPLGHIYLTILADSGTSFDSTSFTRFIVVTIEHAAKIAEQSQLIEKLDRRNMGMG